MATGKLVVNKQKQVRVKWINRKGNEVEMAVRETERSQTLKARIAAGKPEELNGLEVELDEEGGQPVKVRPVGEPFVAPGASPPQKQGRRDDRGRQPTSASSPPTSGRTPAASAARPSVDLSAGLKPAFHNPYNSIPGLPRESLSRASDLADHAPAGHERYHVNRYSGVIRVKLVTQSPLLLADAARRFEFAESHEAAGISSGHKQFPIRRGPDGKPYLPPTSVKGVLRSSYEAITNSRLGVFAAHDERLAFRRAAKVDVAPIRVEEVADDRIVVRVLASLWMNSPAKLGSYDRDSRQIDRGRAEVALRYPDDSLPKHRDHVWVQVSPHGYVTAIKKYEAGQGGASWLEGWVCINNPNINNKRSERVFVVSDKDRLVPFAGDESRRIKLLWSELIRDYQAIHQRDLKKRREARAEPFHYLGNQPGRTAWSRHVYTLSDANLETGTLCYARMSGDRITGLYPVAISRDLFEQSPEQLLRQAQDTLRPAHALSELSPADRVFGWVRQRGHGAYRGNVRIGQVTCRTENAIEKLGDEGLPLAILGQPKPQQARFYVAADHSGAAQANGLSKDQSGYSDDKALRLRKVYPHHDALPEDYWRNPTEDRTQTADSRGGFQEYRRPRKQRREQRDDQNRTMLEWVKPDTEFTFSVYVTNLSLVELGALLWLLDLSKCQQRDSYHRLGGGKPLGFGSAKSEVVGCDLRSGAELAKDYESLLPATTPQFDTPSAVTAFQQAVVDAYGRPDASLVESFNQVPFIAAFLKAAQGLETGLPIHYPRARQPGQQGAVPPHVDGLAYEWFAANDRETTQGTIGLSLPDLARDAGLPILEKKS